MPTPSNSSLWPADGGVDPFLALEALDNESVNAWVSAQSARTAAAFGSGADTDLLTARLARSYLSKDRIVECSRYKDWGYNTWQDDEHPLGIVRRTPWSAWLA